uniref:Small ribosomal subunit protein uS17c n=2 Tax=Pavlovaceae TaxID=418969 RepID=M1JF89_DIALT|nr:ribosomal protein S17 [Diacronema lutheri]YP_009863755.1 ribosomal protein S17 [Pavlova sp. NIVA-4/92]AGE93733.1 ribosomal protein S17 [Diacronema lutheri]QKE31086.1 ribosomal protein S17 [Pavlova sp. NIVA-4/92]|mmetsp:Transcript_11229/g.35458  ORF Transcript_11229/g.35458 Transcript_11229/m.35458 type:complete len:87 (+) Transcript_11229:3979-4239(+)
MVTKERVGIVISNKQDKTVTVAVQRRVAHTKYSKVINISKNYTVSDPNGACQVGDRVRILETRPISKTKRWIFKSLISHSAKSNLV